MILRVKKKEKDFSLSKAKIHVFNLFKGTTDNTKNDIN